MTRSTFSQRCARSKTVVAALAVAGTALFSSASFAQEALKNHDTYQPIDIDAGRLDVKQKNGQAIFKDNVVVKQGGMTLSTDTLTVFFEQAAGPKTGAEAGAETDTNPEIERLDVQGHVKLVSASENITADWGVYDVTQRLVTMGGNVTLIRGDNVLVGNRLELDLVTGRAKLDGDAADQGRVSGRFKAPTTN